MRNHASALLACDFFVVVTATFRVYHVFVVLEVGSRRIPHWNVAEHPSAEWTAQQFRTVMSGEEPHRFLIHDHVRRPLGSGALPSRGDANPERPPSRIPARATRRVSYASEMIADHSAIVSLKEPSLDPGKVHPPEKADHVAFRRAALNR